MVEFPSTPDAIGGMGTFWRLLGKPCWRIIFTPWNEIQSTGQQGGGGSERSGLTLPSPPAHPIVCLTPATRLVGMVVKWRLVVVGFCATVEAIKVAQRKTVLEICILEVNIINYGFLTIELYSGIWIMIIGVEDEGKFV